MRVLTDVLRAAVGRGRWLLLAAVVVVGVAGSANASTSTKWYDATIAGWSTASAGATATFDLTLKNDETSTQTLGSANFRVPSGWTADSVQSTPVLSAGNRTWDIGVDGDAFTFRAATNGDALAPGDSVTARVYTTVSCTSGLATWQIRVKQANSFLGPPGNDFQASDVVGLSGSVGTGGGSPASLAFTTQPADSQTGSTFGAAVTVYDSCGNVASQATGQVSLALVQPEDTDFGGGGTLGGTTLNLDGTVSQPLSSGVASFTDLTVSAAGQGYKLDASFAGVDSVESDPFDVYDFFGDCTFGCSTSDATTTIALGPTAGAAALSLKANSGATCNGLQVLGSAFTIVPPAGHSAFDIPVTLTINKPGLQGVGVSNIVVCKNSGPGTDLEQLGKCPKKGPINDPCIVSQTSSNAGDAIIKMLINSTDPGGAGFG